MINLRTPIARVRGLGSSKSGTAHYKSLYVSAIALTLLTLWLFVGFLGVVGEGRDAIIQWVSYPLNAVLIIAFVYNVFRHMILGLQVVIEDYIHTEWLKAVTLLTVRFGSVYFGLIAMLSVLKIMLNN